MGGFADLIRDVPDFPKPGIVFKDILPVLSDPAAFASAINALSDPWRTLGLTAVAGIEARGFILGAAMARELGVGFVPLRKPGKLPGQLHEVAYALEYGHDRLQVQRDAFAAGSRVLLVDDVLATGGTLVAAAELLQATGAELVGAAVLVELRALGGRARWTCPAPLHATLAY
ncbi:adenine phosphoribosyltransferase [Arenimonas sp. MALMAid1274]|uniref:adenine phosphoribosyltransferase n=1 Tax=Arenimonas sp. MALMAid1274 TaxID=3411630 RepID=UPI003B9F7F75